MKTSVFFISFFLTLVWSSQDVPSPRRRQAVPPKQCTDLMATVDGSCWNALGVTDWLNDWSTRMQCGPNVESDAECCTANEAWSTCFLRLSQPTSGSDCTEIDSCNTYVPSIKANGTDGPKVHYVVYNIYKINHFFTTWYYATLFANTLASGSVTDIVQAVDPPKDTNIVLNDILSALTAGLAFFVLPAETIALGTDVTAQTVAASQALTTALQQAPGVAKLLWPAGPATQTFQIGQLQSAMAGITDQIRTRINDALHMVMTDLPSFQAFAANGVYSGPTPPSLQNETTGLEWAFKTFLISTSLTNNGWDATFTTRDRVGDLDDSGNPDPGLWWCSDQGDNFCFFLNKSLDNNHGSSDNILPKVLGNNGFTTGSLLFDGALTCLQENKNDSVPVSFAADGKSLDLNCLSRVNVCGPHPDAADQPNACPVPWVNGKCPYPSCRG